MSMVLSSKVVFLQTRLLPCSASKSACVEILLKIDSMLGPAQSALISSWSTSKLSKPSNQPSYFLFDPTYLRYCPHWCTLHLLPFGLSLENYSIVGNSFLGSPQFSISTFNALKLWGVSKHKTWAIHIEEIDTLRTFLYTDFWQPQWKQKQTC